MLLSYKIDFQLHKTLKGRLFGSKDSTFSLILVQKASQKIFVKAKHGVKVVPAFQSGGSSGEARLIDHYHGKPTWERQSSKFKVDTNSLFCSQWCVISTRTATDYAGNYAAKTFPSCSQVKDGPANTPATKSAPNLTHFITGGPNAEQTEDHGK